MKLKLEPICISTGKARSILSGYEIIDEETGGHFGEVLANTHPAYSDASHFPSLEEAERLARLYMSAHQPAAPAKATGNVNSVLLTAAERQRASDAQARASKLAAMMEGTCRKSGGTSGSDA